MEKSKISTLVLLLININIFAQPALPELGYRWVLNNECSDEFDGTSALNETVWQNTDTRWIGREPGLFTAEAVTVGEGNLRLTTDVFSEARVVNGKTWTHQGAHVRSKNKVKLGSFVECKMKANKTFMSSTFWLINYSNESTDCQRRTTELDVQECIGYPATHAKTTQMGSNTHSRGIPETCAHIPAGSKGNHAETNGKVYDNYFTYGVWWKSATEILFYLNGEYKYTIKPIANFDIEMYIKLVCETYDWSPVPADGGMTGTWEERTTFYDWVRTYSYLPVDEQSASESNNVFSEEIMFSQKPTSLEADALSFNVNYQSNGDNKIVLEIKDEHGSVVLRSEKELYAGYGNLLMEMEDSELNGTYIAAVSLISNSDHSVLNTAEFSLKINHDTAVGKLGAQTVRIAPNPAGEVMFIKGLDSPTDFELYAITGKLLNRGITGEKDSKIDISDLSSGTYILQLKSGNNIASLKLIKI
ncbi:MULTISPECIES: T9SS type A sorting domain-containing protein [unclassified Saccharicrinis]|uniref:T9SS type A sorting domain-containing protein n=1 Tax=unclassified Saccharicrinis TaxID=2646859 RepID=UPI003D33C50B